MDTRNCNLLIVSPESAGSDLSLQVLFVDSELPNLSTFSSSSDETTRALLDLGGLDAVVYRWIEPRRGFETLRMIRDIAPSVALIVVIPERDRRLASQVLEAGAQDCIFEGELSRNLLHRSVRYAIERRRTERIYNRMASYDLSTGLLNQKAFLALLERWLGRARRGGGVPFALVVFKIPELEECFRRFDRQLAEEALERIARRAQQIARPSDLVAILEGNELALLLPAVDRLQKARIVGKRIACMLARPFNVREQSMQPTVRWSFSMFSRSLQDAREMLDHAVLGLRQNSIPAAASF